MLFKVLRLLEDLFINLITIDRRISIFSDQDDEVHFQFSLDVAALAPVGVSGLVVDDDFHFFCKIEELVLRVLKIVLDGEGFKDVVEGLFFEVNAQFGK